VKGVTGLLEALVEGLSAKCKKMPPKIEFQLFRAKFFHASRYEFCQGSFHELLHD